MRANIKEIKREGYEFVLELDTGGTHKSGDINCWVYEDNGETNIFKKKLLARRDFGASKDFSKVHFYNFINKFLIDEEYRKKYLVIRE